MKLFSFSRDIFVLGATALLLLKNQVLAKRKSFWDDVPGVVTSCDDFLDGEGEIVASGMVTFLRPMHCAAHAPMVSGRSRNSRENTSVAHRVSQTRAVYFQGSGDAKNQLYPRPLSSHPPTQRASHDPSGKVEGYSWAII